MHGGEKRAYTVSLKAGEYVEVVAEQQGLDVVLYLFDPAGKQVMKIDGTTGTEGPENLAWVAETGGAYRLEVVPDDKDAKPGRYELSLVELHPATERDRKRVRALGSLADALFTQNSEEKDADQQALKKYQEALALLRETGDAYHETFAVEGVCREFEKTGQWSEALASCQSGYDNAQKSGDKAVQANMAYRLAMAQSAAQHRPEAAARYKEAADLFRELGQEGNEAAARAELGFLLIRTGKYEEAKAELTRELELREKSGELRSLATCQYRLGYAHEELGDKVKAEALYSKAIAAARQVHAAREEALALEIRGNLYSKSDQKEKALADYKQAIPRYHEAQDPEDEAGMYLAAAGALDELHTHRDSSEQTTALEKERDDYLARGLAIARENKRYHQQALFLEKMGTVLYYTPFEQDDQRAKPWQAAVRDRKRAALVESQELLHQYGKPEEEARVWAELADLDVKREDRKSSILDAQQALALYRQTGDVKKSVEMLVSIVHDAYALKDYDAAWQAFEQQESIWREQKNTAKVAEMLVGKGGVEMMRGRRAEAMALFQRAIADCPQETKGCKDMLGEAHRFLGVAYLEAGEKEKALEEFNTDFALMKQGDGEFIAFVKKVGADVIYDPELTVRQGEILQQKQLVSLDEVWDRFSFTSLTGWETANHFADVATKVADELKVPGLRDSVILATVMQLTVELAIANEHLKALLKQNEALKAALEERIGKKPAEKTAQAESDKSRADKFESEGESAMRREGLQQAVAALSQALELRRKLGRDQDTAKTLSVLGDAWLNLNEGQKALAAYQEARERWHAAGQDKDEVEALLGVGIAYNWLGQREKALAAHQEAVKVARAGKLQEQEQAALYRVGETYLLMGQKRDALANLLAAKDLSKPSGLLRREESHAQILALIGLTYASLGDAAHAKEFYAQAAEEFERGLRGNMMFLNLRAKGRGINQLGDAYAAMGEAKQAEQTFRKGLIVQRNFGSLGEQAYALERIGQLQLQQGGAENAKKAIEPLQQALEITKKNGNPVRQGEVLHDLGLAYEQAGDAKTALGFFDQALAVRYRIRDLDGEGETLDRLMRLWKGMKQPALAAFYGKQAVNAYQQIRVNMQGIGDDLQKSYLHSHYGTYRELADVLIAQGRIPEAQQVLDLLKTEEYMDFVRRDGSDFASGMASSTKPESTAWEGYQKIQEHIVLVGRRYAELAAKESLTAAEKREFAHAEKELSLANDSFDAYLARLPGEFGSASKGDVEAERVREGRGLQETLRELGNGTVAVYTVVTEERYHVILYTPDTQKNFTYEISAADLNAKVLKFQQVLKEPRYDPVPMAQEMYKILVAPVQRALDEAGAKTLMWSLDGALRYVPIAALHDGKQYLVERYNLTIFTPASHSRLEKPAPEKWRGLGMGVSKGTYPLPYVPDELRSVIRDDQDAESRQGVVAGKILLDDTFTKDAMKDALAHGKGYTLVHVASHFRFRPGTDNESYLLLGGPEPDKDNSRHLSLQELRSGTNIFRGVELLTLSACNTAVGSGQGSEVENFAVLAQIKGARAVIATLWSVADASTMRLMQDFYRHHDEHPGAPKIEDLRRAQLDLLHGCPVGGCGQVLTAGAKKRSDLDDDSDAEIDAPPFHADPKAPFAHPYFWAPFVLIGNWR